MRNTLLPTVTLIGCLTITSHAQDWDGDTSTDFANGDNWVGGTAPNGTQGFFINNITDGTTFAPVLTSSYTLNPDGATGDAEIGTSGGDGTLDINAGGTLDGSGNWLFIGRGGGTGSAVTVNDGGSLVSDNDVRLDAGSVTVNNGGTVNVSRIVQTAGTSVTVNGTGNLTTNSASTSNGSPDIQNLTINNLTSGGSVSGARNVVFGNSTSTIDGGTINAGSEIYVGNGSGSNSTLIVDSGTVTSNAWIAVGRNGSTGELNINGGTITQATQFIPLGSDLGAGAGNGTINQTSGTLTAPAARLGENGASVGTYNISGGTFDAGAGALEIGYNNNTTGTLHISSSATVTSTGTTFLGKFDDSVGNLTVDGSAATISLGDLWVGLDDTGTDSGAVGTIAFVADGSGVSIINVSGDVNLMSPDGDFLQVDLSAMSGAGVIDIQLIDGTTSQGEFTGLTQGATVPGAFGGTIDYSVAGDVWLRGVTIPEPSIALLGGLGIIGMLRRRRTN